MTHKNYQLCRTRPFVSDTSFWTELVALSWLRRIIRRGRRVTAAGESGGGRVTRSPRSVALRCRGPAPPPQLPRCVPSLSRCLLPRSPAHRWPHLTRFAHASAAATVSGRAGMLSPSSPSVALPPGELFTRTPCLRGCVVLETAGSLASHRPPAHRSPLTLPYTPAGVAQGRPHITPFDHSHV